ncbi:acyl-CoA dehydrogenase family protein [Actinomadura roseirufa]|uniref:acyl-CoA dehydrogenase family protein n=1 Tax=Actinomadura roseirufa TaxID=2094049 RepID=UPI0010417EBD|nr:acyl-CoA dehydrogenase family protein [Actinomadura roseirufa]
MRRTVYDADQEAFRAVVRDFIAAEVVPHHAEWEENGMAPRSFYEAAGALGITGLQIPEQYGGGGQSTFKFNCVVNEEAQAAQVSLGSLRVHLDVTVPYFLRYATDEQRERWFPGICDGTLMTAIAITEPGTGSDMAGITTAAVRDGDDYVLSGAKTFISGGAQAGLVLVVARTSPLDDRDRRAGLSILVVEEGMAGFGRGRKLSKLGLLTQDTLELFFDEVRVPARNLLGEEGAAFGYLTSNLPQERLTVAVGAQAAAASAVRITSRYVRERSVFGRPLAGFQNTKFVLAECATEVAAGQTLCDRAIAHHDAGELTPAVAAMVKLFCTEMQGRVIDKCLQLFGGYGYTREYPIARLYADARVTRIYAGTSEVMKSIISKEMGL